VEASEDELSSYLDPGEKLLWAGRPVQGIVLTPLDWYFIPFSVVWFGTVLYIFWQGATKTSEPMSSVVSVLFVGIGIYLLVGRFFADAFYRSRLVYGVTDRRAIIASGILQRSVQSIDLSSLSGLKREDRADGSGTIFLGDQPWYWYGWYGPGFLRPLGTMFFRIADAKRVYTIVREAMQRQKK
jgi:hypothetical protein